ncbi:MAG: esterase [Flavobacteriaceae bacterium]
MDNLTSVVNKVSYTTVNTYDTLNTLSDSTQNIWIVFHGMGFLSRYFLKNFQGIPKNENFVIAPQAPSKYYLDDRFSRIGASWLTREQTEGEMLNNLSYLDAVFDHLSLPEDLNLIVLGFSQGVSIASRWVAKRKINCQKLVLYAGGLPEELRREDFDFLAGDTDILMVHGDHDPYLSPERLKREEEKLYRVFQHKARKMVFEGGHIISPAIIENIVGP